MISITAATVSATSKLIINLKWSTAANVGVYGYYKSTVA